MAAPSKLKLTPEAFKALRSRVYRITLIVAGLLLTIGHEFVGKQIDTYVAGLHLPAGVAIPAGAAIVSAVVSWIGAKVGTDPTTTLFEGMLDRLKGNAPADAIEVDDRPPPPILQGPPPAPAVPPPVVVPPVPPVQPRPGLFAPEGAEPAPAAEVGPPAAVEPEQDHEADQAALAAAMMDMYAGSDHVEFTDTPNDPQGPHGANQPGETDGAPSPMGEGD